MTLGSGRVLDGSFCVCWYARVSTATPGCEAARPRATKLTVRSSGAIAEPSSSVAAPSAPEVHGLMLSACDTDTTVGAAVPAAAARFASVVDELARALEEVLGQPVGEPAERCPPNHAGCAAASDGGASVNAVCTPPGGLAKTIRAPPPPPPSKPPWRCCACAHAGCLIALTA